MPTSMSHEVMRDLRADDSNFVPNGPNKRECYFEDGDLLIDPNLFTRKDGTKMLIRLDRMDDKDSLVSVIQAGGGALSTSNNYPTNHHCSGDIDKGVLYLGDPKDYKPCFSGVDIFSADWLVESAKLNNLQPLKKYLYYSGSSGSKKTKGIIAKTPTAKDRRRNRVNYTSDDDDAICDFVDLYSTTMGKPGGKKLWHYAVKINLCDGRHSYQSLRERYTKQLRLRDLSKLAGKKDSNSAKKQQSISDKPEKTSDSDSDSSSDDNPELATTTNAASAVVGDEMNSSSDDKVMKAIIKADKSPKRRKLSSKSMSSRRNKTVESESPLRNAARSSQQIRQAAEKATKTQLLHRAYEAQISQNDLRAMNCEVSRLSKVFHVADCVVFHALIVTGGSFARAEAFLLANGDSENIPGVVWSFDNDIVLVESELPHRDPALRDHGIDLPNILARLSYLGAHDSDDTD